MTKEDLIVNECNGEIVQVSHKEFDCDMFEVSEPGINTIKSRIKDFVDGKNKTLNVWTDGDYEEPATRVFLSRDKFGCIVYIDDLESLVGAIHSGRKLIAVDIEDNLI